MRVNKKVLGRKVLVKNRKRSPTGNLVGVETLRGGEILSSIRKCG
jgi:hypothetical protein